MFEIRETEEFQKWLRNLKDRRAVVKITSRIRQTAFGSFGDVKPVGEGVSEMRINYGPGYRPILSSVGGKLLFFCVGEARKPKTKTS